jgi:Mn-dependent DtxR family transcriptional regulator
MQNKFKNRLAGASTEDYLTAVYEVCAKNGGAARQYEIAAHIGFSKTSVMRGVDILVQKGLARVEKEFGDANVRLTDDGCALAQKLLEKRRIIAALLKSLGLPEDAAKTEAHLWQRGISDETVTAMKAALQHPKAKARPKPKAAAPGAPKFTRPAKQRVYSRPARAPHRRVLHTYILPRIKTPASPKEKYKNL